MWRFCKHYRLSPNLFVRKFIAFFDGLILFDVLTKVVGSIKQVCLACKTIHPPTVVRLFALPFWRMLIVPESERSLNGRHTLYEKTSFFWHIVSLLSYNSLSALSISCPKSLMRIGTMLFSFRRRRESPLAKGTAEHFLPFQSRYTIGKSTNPTIAYSG